MLWYSVAPRSFRTTFPYADASRSSAVSALECERCNGQVRRCVSVNGSEMRQRWRSGCACRMSRDGRRTASTDTRTLHRQHTLAGVNVQTNTRRTAAPLTEGEEERLIADSNAAHAKLQTHAR
eukprot:2898477-Rhodomonas_salina.1